MDQQWGLEILVYPSVTIASHAKTKPKAKHISKTSFITVTHGTVTGVNHVLDPRRITNRFHLCSYHKEIIENFIRFIHFILLVLYLYVCIAPCA